MVEQQWRAIVQPAQISSAPVVAQYLVPEIASNGILRAERELNRTLVFSDREIGYFKALQQLPFQVTR
jgi:hypothetical protein